MSKTRLFPFVYHNGLVINYYKPKKTLFMDFKKLFELNKIDPEDTAILHMLQKYYCLNAYLIRILLEQQMAECNKKFCSKHLKKLEELGMIQKYQFIYTTEDGTIHKTPFVYELSGKAKKVFAINNKKMIFSTMEVEHILRRLSFNQFHIMFEKQMTTSLEYSSYHFDSYSDGTYKFMSNGKQVLFYLFSIRSEENWREKYLKRLRSLTEYIDENELHCSGIIVVCENEMQSLASERYRKSDESVKDANIYYICDYAAVAEGYILQFLINVLPENNYSAYNILKIPVDGNISLNISTDDVEEG